MRAFREATQIMVKMWTEETPSFEGEYYHIGGPINEPRGVQRPCPSLWISGGGEQVTLKLVAQSTNANIVFLKPGDEIAAATEKVRATCGWSVEELQRSAIVGTPEQVAPQLG